MQYNRSQVFYFSGKFRLLLLIALTSATQGKLCTPELVLCSFSVLRFFLWPYGGNPRFWFARITGHVVDRWASFVLALERHDGHH